MQPALARIEHGSPMAGSVIDIDTGKSATFSGPFSSTMGRALAQFRADGVKAPSLYYLQELGTRVDSLVAEISKGRGDAVGGIGPNQGFHLKTELEHIYREVLRETPTPNNALTMIPIDRSVPPGATGHRVQRFYSAGEAAVYRAGVEIPRVNLARQTELFPVRHYVTSFVINLFERLSAGFANSNMIAELFRTARDVINEFLNLATWFGLENEGIYGVLSYPWLPKALSPITWDGATPLAELAELNRLVNYPRITHKATVAPDTVITSPRLRSHLHQTPMSADNSKTIAEVFLANQPLISAIDEAWELQDTGPSDTDAILIWKKDRRGFQNVIPQGFAALPAQTVGFDDTTFAYMSHGGVILRDPIGALLAWAIVPD